MTAILTTYNGVTRGFLSTAIESLLSQSYSPVEVLLVDDGSTDGTGEICKKFLSYGSVRYLYKENGGPASARNLGIREASYPLVTFLDDDDFYEPTMVERMVHTLEKSKGKGRSFAYCRTRHIDSSGRALKTPLYRGKLPLYEALFYGNVLSVPAVIIPRELLMEVGLFREHLLYAEDYDLWLRMAEVAEAAACDEVLVNIRLHERQLSRYPLKMELYHSIALFEAIERGSGEIKAQADAYRYSFYLNYMKIYLGLGCYRDFRRLYLSARCMGPLPLSWKIKYLLSYSPKLFAALHSLAKWGRKIIFTRGFCSISGSFF